jgi:hypothetical protein
MKKIHWRLPAARHRMPDPAPLSQLSKGIPTACLRTTVSAAEEYVVRGAIVTEIGVSSCRRT